MPPKYFIRLALGLLLFFFVDSAPTNGQESQLRLATVFGDHMVLQRDQPIPVWGWAAPNDEITVSIADRTASAIADDDGKWMAKLSAMPAGGPHELNIHGKQTLSLADVLVGEVWLCSGQSNMAMTVARSKDFDSEKSLANLPEIRMITVARDATPNKAEDISGKWTVASPDSVGSFSATAWFFGQKLHQELDVPIGLINSSWGGTDIASWTSRSAQKSNDVLSQKMNAFDDVAKQFDLDEAKQRHEKALAKWKAKAQEKKAAGKKVGKRPKRKTDPMFSPHRPSNLFNGMINPLIPFSMRGAIWYQGERNSKTLEAGKLYKDQLPLLINDWRARWGIGDFPFITVQLPNFHAKPDTAIQNTGWVMVREGQMKSLALQNTGIAITTDVGMAKDIHPVNKQAIGQRLALWALGTTYGKDLIHSGPIFSTCEFDTTSKRAVVSMAHAGDGLKTSDSKAVSGFAVAGDDRVFHEATATFDASQKKLFVSCDAVENPIAVRYNWADNPTGNLVNSAELPAAPFRSDDWKIEAN